MKELELVCGACRATMRFRPTDLGTTVSCTSCGNVSQVLTFPALVRRAAGSAGAAAMEAGEATCFFHTSKKAAVPCDGCGRFLCALCDINFSDGHFCSLCIETGTEQAVAGKMVSRRYLYDSMALLLILSTLLFWPFTLITAPMALFIAIRFYGKAGGPIPRSNWRFLVAILMSSAIILGWAALLITFISGLI